MKRIALCCLFALAVCSCATTRGYKPNDSEKPYFEAAIKHVFPSDVVANPDKYQHQLIHWVGIIDTFEVFSDHDTVVAMVTLDQKYYDYIEDFSIQREKMFLSPKGEGKFIFRRIQGTAASIDSTIKELSALAADDNLGFCYGDIVGIREGKPIMNGAGMRIIPREYYSTEIFSYEPERDSLGNVVVGRDGMPVLTNFEILKIPGPAK